MAQIRRYLIAVCVLFLATLARAQPTEAVAFNFRVVAPQALPPDLMVRAPTGQLQPITFTPFARSSAYRYRGPSRLSFYQTQGDRVAGQEAPSLQEVASIIVPEGMKEPLFIFFASPPKTGAATRWSVFALEDSWASFPARRLALINASGHVLEGAVSGQPTRLGPGLAPLFTVGGSAAVQLAIPFQGKYYAAFEQSFEIGADERVLGIFLPPPTQASPVVRKFLLVDTLKPLTSGN